MCASAITKVTPVGHNPDPVLLISQRVSKPSTSILSYNLRLSLYKASPSKFCRSEQLAQCWSYSHFCLHALCLASHPFRLPLINSSSSVVSDIMISRPAPCSWLFGSWLASRRAVESESEGILGGVGKNVPTPTHTSI
jgi:hypothetical protein